MPEQRIHQKELKKRLKEDEVALFFEDIRDSIRHYAEKYGRVTFWTVIGLCLLFGVTFLWRWKQSTDFLAAQEIYSTAATLVDRGDYGSAETTLTELIERFSGQDCVSAAYVLRGFARHKQKNYDGAFADYQTALQIVKDLPTRYSIRLALAQVHRSQGDIQTAITELESLRSEVDTPEMRDQVTFLLAQCKEDLNQPEEALALYEEIPKDSNYRSQALNRITWLKTQPAPPINPVG